ncbi:hypothetical protein [Hyphomicrobium sp. D-2]|uniref:hypothetical protein n=1 Tax=Hyphomicrobium sp. D-2 TaxID=3041621 RepID=UPI00245685CE|nr:hypothetical protein [Hyphomicrobium sp. D-2]MDH4980930.1 hypothetical protein [Hyphomicrobium sp. D-2]
MRVFEEAEGGFKLLRGVTPWGGVLLQLFDDDELVLLQPGDAPFIGCDHGRRGGFHDAVEQLLDLLLGPAKVVAESLGDLLGTAGVLLPCIEEQVFEQCGGLR